jgi:hypothetical protein
MADLAELLQRYGYGPQDPGPDETYDTRNVLDTMQKRAPTLLNRLAGAIPQNTGIPSETTYGPFGEEYKVDYVSKGPSLAGILQGGLDTAGRWLGGNPEVGRDTLAPLGLAVMGRAPVNSLASGAARRGPEVMSSKDGGLSVNQIREGLNSATSQTELDNIWNRRDPSLTWEDHLAPLQKVYSQRLGQISAAERAAAKADAVKTLGPPTAGKEYTLYHGMIDDYGKTPGDARWFTTDREHAKQFGEVSQRAASFTNPAYLRVNHSDVPVGRAGDDWLFERANALFSKGHDAVFVQGWEGDGMTVLARDALD